MKYSCQTVNVLGGRKVKDWWKQSEDLKHWEPFSSPATWAGVLTWNANVSCGVFDCPEGSVFIYDELPTSSS